MAVFIGCCRATWGLFKGRTGVFRIARGCRTQRAQYSLNKYTLKQNTKPLMIAPYDVFINEWALS